MPRARFVSFLLLFTSTAFFCGCSGIRTSTSSSNPPNSDNSHQQDVEYSTVADPICEATGAMLGSLFEESDCGHPQGSVLLSADVNHDHIDDLVEFGDSLIILRGSASGRFTPVRLPADNEYVTGVAVGDFNRDGLDDIAACVTPTTYPPAPYWLEMYASDASGRYYRTERIALSGRCTSLFAGDVNNDGKQDLVLALTTNGLLEPFVNSLITQFGDGTGHFSHRFVQANLILKPQGLNNAPVPQCGITSIVPADFDHDGIVDIAVGTSSEGVIPEGAAYIGRGDLTGHFQLTQIAAKIAGHSVQKAIDLNADGWADLMLLRYYSGPFASGGTDLSVGMNSGNGAFSFATLDERGTYAGSGDYLRGWAFGDFDGTGPIDAIISYAVKPCCAEISTNFVSILHIDNSGTATEGPTWKVINMPPIGAAGDFNGDGRMDFVGIEGTYSASDSSILLYLNRGD